MMIHRLPITKARINLGQLAKRVHLHKEYFILEKGGIPVIGIMDAEEMEDYLEVRDPEVRRFIARGHQQYAGGKSRPAEELLDELRQVNVKATRGRPRRKA